MKKEFTCIICGKKFMDELDESVENAVQFSMCLDCGYLFEKLKPILRDITYESFSATFSKTVRPELVHSFNENDI